jgi:hypothetical protein
MGRVPPEEITVGKANRSASGACFLSSRRPEEVVGVSSIMEDVASTS